MYIAYFFITESNLKFTIIYIFGFFFYVVYNPEY